MKLAFCLFKYFPFGGLQRDFLRIAQECMRRGHTVEVFTMSWEGPVPSGVRVTTIPTQGLWNHRRCLSFIKQVSTYLKQGGYDRVVGFNKMPGLDVYFAADPCYRGKVHAQRNFWYRLTERYRVYAKLERAVFNPKAHTKILLLVNREQIQFQHYYATPNERFYLLPPGIDTERRVPPNAAEIRAALRQEFKIKPHDYLVLMVGSSFKTKGVDRALLALQALPLSLKQRTYLFIIGQGDAKPFIKMADRLGVTKQVQFLGGRDDVSRFLLGADLLLHSSYGETAGAVLLEAVVAGLPVLTTHACGYAEHIERAQAGVVLPLPFQQKELNRQLTAMLNIEKQEIWRKNALAYADTHDLYSLAERAVDYIEKQVTVVTPSVPENKNLFLNDELRKYWYGKDVFSEVFRLTGKLYRQQKNRATLRVTISGKNYFVKRHSGVGWLEIGKNLLYGRLPVLGAKQEQRAIQRLTELQIPTTPLAGYGNRGLSPAARQSFVITEELTHIISLEDFCRHWVSRPPAPALKRALINEVARIARVIHTHGINHRDFYLCHFLLDVAKPVTAENIKFYLIDLHRVQIRKRIPRRWRVKDLAGLYFSSLHIGLTKRDILRFIKAYGDRPLRDYLAIEKRATKLYGKDQQRLLTTATSAKDFAPFPLVSDKGNIIECHKLLRVVPNKRWVFAAHWHGQPVIAKVVKKWRHVERELRGYHALQTAGVLTPTLLYHGWLRDDKSYILLYQQIQAEQPNLTQRDELIISLVPILSNLHEAGFKQDDPHFNNFLVSNKKIYLIDTASIIISKKNQPLAEQEGLKNLALLLVQLPTYDDAICQKVCVTYLQARNLVFTLEKFATFKKWVSYWRRRQLIAYGRKALRSSSDFSCRRSWRYFSVCDRNYDTEAMQLFLADPEAVLQGPLVKILKAGNSCTVALIEINGRKLVVKRYNIKGWWQRLKYALRSSRAAISWRNAQRLSMIDIPTAKPVAMLEKRFGPLRSTSYFINEYVAGKSLQDYFRETNSLEEQLYVSKRITDLFNSLIGIQVSHGDLKATNILIASSKPILLDLDAMRLHRLPCRWRAAHQRDQKRFMKNWENQPEIQKLFR